MEKTILYLEKPGKANTDAVLEAVRARACELGIRTVVVATTHGYTAKRAHAVFSGTPLSVVAVTISAGFAKEGWTMKASERAALSKLGVRVLTCQHSLGGDVAEGLETASPAALVSQVLYRFCQGMKVAVEVALMAADAGLLDMRREIIAVAGTGEGADTAVVLKPAYGRAFSGLEIREIIAKPRSA
jgi:uncharacterized protein